MIMRSLAAILAAAWLCLSSTASAAELSASLDRDHAQLGETVTLTVSVENASASSAPDFSVLAKDFDVLGTSVDQSINVRNGTVSKIMRWGIALKPLHTGEIVIPALPVGNAMTTPLHLSVGEPVAGVQGDAGDEVFVEVSIEPASAYVGQQMLLIVRLYYDGPLAQGNLDMPTIDGAELRQLGEDVNYRAQRAGRMYRVVERRYALLAHAPGTLTVPAVQFQGQMQDRRYGSFFGGVRSVQARSSPHEVSIAAAPANDAGATWLPAHALKLSLTGLPTDGSAEVGVPINLRLSLQATGLPFESLPKLSLPTIDGARVYPSEEVTSTSNDDRWLQGQREREFAVVPTQSGVLTIPQISVPWWNTQTDTQEIVRIPARSLHVQAEAAGAPGGAATPSNQAATHVADTANVDAGQPTPAGEFGQEPRMWRLVATAAIGLWLLTVLIWWLRRRGARELPVQRPPDTSKLANRKRAFSAANNAHDVAHTLLAWAQVERPQLQNLGDLAAQLDSAEQTAAIARLERHRYASATAELDIAAIQGEFRRGFIWLESSVASDEHSLPPLY